MHPRLSKAAVQLREQFDDAYPDRDHSSDGWIGDSRHANTVSDHNPDANGWVRAIDVDADLYGGPKPAVMPYVANQLRLACKAKTEKRIAYIIFNGKIASPKQNWKWRTYTGVNPHTCHMHISFTKEADLLGEFYQIPMLGGTA